MSTTLKKYTISLTYLITKEVIEVAVIGDKSTTTIQSAIYKARNSEEARSAELANYPYVPDVSFKENDVEIRELGYGARVIYVS